MMQRTLAIFSRETGPESRDRAALAAPIARTRLLASFIALTCLCTSLHAATIHRRGALPPIEGTLAPLTDRGVHVRTDAGVLHDITWDHIRAIDMQSPPPDLDEYLALAEDLWRARARLQRHDVSLAEPLFARHFPRYRGQNNPTALMIAEGLLRCRLARGAQINAIEPAVEYIRLRRAGISSEVFAALPDIYDERYELITTLPPMFASPQPAAAGPTPDSALKPDHIPADIAELYAAALDHRAADVDRDHRGVTLLLDIINATRPDETIRLNARQRLLALLNEDEAPVWLRAWIHAALGQSLILETDVSRQRRGMVHLLHLPARYTADQPWLTAYALYRAAEHLTQLNQPHAAATLAGERAARFPMFTFPVSHGATDHGATSL